jgi:excinuclease UvrABC nuclease subunit
MTNSSAQPRSIAEAEFLHRIREALVHDPPEVVVDGTVDYTLGGSLSVPEEPGVYLVHDLRGVLYIGRTANMHQRYLQHYRDSHNSRVTAVLRRPLGRLQFSWMTVDVCDQARLERNLIRAIQPLCNRLLYRNDHQYQ